MRHKSADLEKIYRILRKLDKPIALFDFLSGEMGYEALCAQAICGRFADDVGRAAPVVALAWAGCALWYENVSPHQVILDDVEQSMHGNLRHRGEPRWAWLTIKDHRERIGEIEGIIKHVGPSYWGGGHVDDERLAGFIRPHFLTPAEGLKTNREGIIKSAANRLEKTGYIFQPPGERLVAEPYIALFDRNEQRTLERNTKKWHIKWLQRVAKACGVRLVVVSGLHPRTLPDDVIHFRPQGRDIDLLCNVVRHALFFASPPCGAAEVAAVLGCDFLALGHLGVGHDDLVRMVTGRGFRFLGVMEGKRDKRTQKMVRHHIEKCLAS